MNGKFRLSIFFVLSLWYGISFAQNPKTSFKYLSLKEGLSQSPIFSIMQDKVGFVWIGSRNGLTRYDGYEFKVYQNEELNRTVSQRDINSIIEDIDNNLWLATSGGLYQFLRDTEEFVKIHINGVKFTSSLYPVGNNKLWITTDKGIKLLDCKTKLITDFISHEQSGMFVHKIFKDKSGILWSCSVKGIRCFRASDGKPVSVPQAIQDQLNKPLNRIFSIQEDVDGDIWIGTETSGLFWYKRATGQCINFKHSYNNPGSILSDFVKDIFVNTADEVWVGTRNGLSIFNKKTQKFSNYEHRSDVKGSLSHNTIWKIMKDRTGSIWLATYAGGLNLYNPINNNFSTIAEKIGNGGGLNNAVVNALLGDPDGGIWAGTDGGGLNYINTEKGIFRYYSVQDIAANKTSNIVKGLCRDGKGNLWVATLDGLAKFEPSLAKVSYVNLKSGIRPTTFRANGLLCTDNGIWVYGDVDGLRFRGNDGTFKAYRKMPEGNSISSNHINCLLEDTDKKGLWIGTREGLCYLEYQTGKFITYKSNGDDYRSNVVISLMRDSKNRLWLGTQLGLRVFSKAGKSNLSITKADGLADNTIQAIVEDRHGNLWLSTSNSMSSIKFINNSKNLPEKGFKITNYTSHDGLSSNLWTPNAAFKTSSGIIFFGGVNGINSFQPDRIVKNNHTPTVVVTSFMVKNKTVTINSKETPLKEPIESTRSIVLNYNQNSFTFQFSALNFINPQKNSYAYKMEGLNYNHDWNYAGGQRLATYTELGPGTYTFKVKAANNDGVWSKQPYAIQVTILPPFWATWWAYGLYVLAVFSLLYFIVRFFRRQAKLERDLFYEHLQYERQQDLHQMKLNFFTNISHELRTPLTLIAAPVEKLVKETVTNDYLNKQLRTIQVNTARLLKLINELMDFRKTETGNMKLHVQQSDINSFAHHTFSSFTDLANTRNIHYVFLGFDAEVALFFDYDQLEKVLFNLLSNSFKFTPPGGLISLRLTESVDEVQIAIVDNGTGIPFEDQNGIFKDFYQGGKHNPNIGTGIGLAFSKSIVDLHHGNLTFKSNPVGAAGAPKTEFTISLKRGSAHFKPEELNSNVRYEALSSEITTSNEVGQPISYGELVMDRVAGHRQTILVVEDNDEVRDFIVESLKPLYSVTGCENGIAGYEAAIAAIPDLIITDVMMPGMDGMELCQKIKSDQRTSHIPVILLTARAAPIHQISGLETGADVYISKPFSLEILLLNIRNLLSLVRTMQEKFSEELRLQPRNVVIASKDGDSLKKLINIVEDKMEDPEFGVAELALEIGMSQPVLYRKVKALTDMTVADFIKSIRLKRAAMLLVQQTMTIADVAFAVGFNNRKHFSKEFRKQFNESPSTYLSNSIALPTEIEDENFS